MKRYLYLTILYLTLVGVLVIFLAWSRYRQEPVWYRYDCSPYWREATENLNRFASLRAALQEVTDEVDPKGSIAAESWDLSDTPSLYLLAPMPLQQSFVEGLRARDDLPDSWTVTCNRTVWDLSLPTGDRCFRLQEIAYWQVKNGVTTVNQRATLLNLGTPQLRVVGKPQPFQGKPNIPPPTPVPPIQLLHPPASNPAVHFYSLAMPAWPLLLFFAAFPPTLLYVLFRPLTRALRIPLKRPRRAGS